LLIPTIVPAEVRLPAILSDGMVLQRNLPLHFWGTASPGERVTVTFLKQSGSTTADSLGHWHVYLQPVAAGGPYEITIQGNNSIVLHDVLVGDVWVASGQSNMEFPMNRLEDATKEIAGASFPNIRLLSVNRAASEYPLSDVSTKGWAHCTPDSVRDFSAVAYYFARELMQKEKVPVGVIGSYWGGTIAESWTSLDALSSDPALMPIFAGRAHFMDDREDVNAEQKREADQTAAAKEKGLPPPQFPWHPEPEMWRPASLFNAMISPLTPLPIRGV